MKALYSFILLYVILPVTSCVSQSTDLSAYENECVTAFNNFTKTLASFVKFNQTNSFGDAAKSKLYPFLFINYPVSDEHSDNTSGSKRPADKELDQFYQYFLNQRDQEVLEHLKIIPFRKKKNDIYDALTNFQKDNTFVFFDDRKPEKILSYVLFIPKIKDIDGPKIWSWTLMYKFGKFVYRSVEGKEGEEYLFSPESFK